MATKKDMMIKVSPDQIMHSGISRSKDGYNSAGFMAKLGESEYMNVSYEWRGDNVPDFIFDLMSFIQSNKATIEESTAALAEEYAAKKASKKAPMMTEEEIMNDPDMTDEEKQAMLDKLKTNKK